MQKCSDFSSGPFLKTIQNGTVGKKILKESPRFVHISKILQNKNNPHFPSENISSNIRDFCPGRSRRNNLKKIHNMFPVSLVKVLLFGKILNKC